MRTFAVKIAATQEKFAPECINKRKARVFFVKTQVFTFLLPQRVRLDRCRTNPL